MFGVFVGIRDRGMGQVLRGDDVTHHRRREVKHAARLNTNILDCVEFMVFAYLDGYCVRSFAQMRIAQNRKV